MHQRFIDAINANPDDRATQLIYADWLDQQGDPRAEAWRVLIEDGKRPDFKADPRECPWDWYPPNSFWKRIHPSAWLPSMLYERLEGFGFDADYPTFFAAMDAAAIAWVRCHRDPEFMRETTPVEAD